MAHDARHIPQQARHPDSDATDCKLMSNTLWYSCGDYLMRGVDGIHWDELFILIFAPLVAHYGIELAAEEDGRN